MSLSFDLLRQSFALALERRPDLTIRFFELLFARYPRLEPLFGRGARPQQARMLAEALGAMVDHLEDAPWLRRTLAALGARHAGYGVTADMYPMVGKALLAALAEAAGSDWTPEVERAWAAAYGAITSLMLEGAARVTAA